MTLPLNTEVPKEQLINGEVKRSRFFPLSATSTFPIGTLLFEFSQPKTLVTSTSYQYQHTCEENC